MSRQQSLEQERATAAWKAIVQVKGQSYQDKYKSLAANAPADIQSNGLGQTLAFWKAKGGEEHRALYQALAVWIKGQLSVLSANDLLVWVMQTATTDQYRRATAEAISFLSWIKRFAEAELGGK